MKKATKRTKSKSSSKRAGFKSRAKSKSCPLAAVDDVVGAILIDGRPS
jgi:hypothetical protein